MLNFMLTLTVFINLHFLFDWILQPRYIAKTKKTNPYSLIKHIMYQILPLNIIYFVVLMIFDQAESFSNALLFVHLNLLSHIIIDSFLPSSKNERWMVNWTAIDQMLHLTFLTVLLYLFVWY